MEYTIHGKKIEYDGQECGIYRQADVFGMDYAVMNIDDLICRINSLPKDEAIKAITGLDTIALEQTQWTDTSKKFGYPILIGGPERTPLKTVKPFIQNIYNLTQAMLNALQ